jgi:hypothetical protein
MVQDYPLYIHITYDIKKDKPSVKTNVRKDSVDDLLMEVLRGQIGTGVDPRKAEEREVYHVKVRINLESDSFSVSDDTGNFGLRDGIIRSTMGKWR